MAHNTFVLEVTDHSGKTRLHGLGVGGTPNINAEDVARHFQSVDHFGGKAKKVKILHRSHIVKKALSDIHKVKKTDLAPVLPTVEVHEDANGTHPDLDKVMPAPMEPTTTAAPAQQTATEESLPQKEETSVLPPPPGMEVDVEEPDVK